METHVQPLQVRPGGFGAESKRQVRWLEDGRESWRMVAGQEVGFGFP